MYMLLSSLGIVYSVSTRMCVMCTHIHIHTLGVAWRVYVCEHHRDTDRVFMSALGWGDPPLSPLLCQVPEWVTSRGVGVIGDNPFWVHVLKHFLETEHYSRAICCWGSPRLLGWVMRFRTFGCFLPWINTLSYQRISRTSKYLLTVCFKGFAMTDEYNFPLMTHHLTKTAANQWCH